MSYPKDLNDLAVEAHAYSKSRGFWGVLGAARLDEGSEFATGVGLAKLMLIVTELAEAAEVLRDDNDHAWEDHLSEELADVLIRTLDLAEAYNLNIQSAVTNKMTRNLERPKMHGKRA